MRILEIIFSLTPGGGERFVVDLSNEMSKTEDVILMLLKDSHSPDDNRNFYKDEVSERVKCINLDLPDGFHISSQWAVYQAIKRVRPDIVHLQADTMPKFAAFAIFMLCRKMKFIQTIHNDLHNGYDTGINRFIYNTLGKIGLYRCVTLSEKNYNDFKMFYPSLHMTCIVNGRANLTTTNELNNVRAELHRYRNDADTKLFIHIARCCDQKNQDLLIDAFNQLYDNGLNISLLIIGSGFDSAKGVQLQKKAKNHIHFLGTKKNIADYLQCSDIFTLSSIFEGMPISLIEASLLGLPCVCTPVCGAVDLIVNGENGVVSEDFTIDSYTKALAESVRNYNILKAKAMLMKKNSPYRMEICSRKYLEYFAR